MALMINMHHEKLCTDSIMIVDLSTAKRKKKNKTKQHRRNDGKKNCFFLHSKKAEMKHKKAVTKIKDSYHLYDVSMINSKEDISGEEHTSKYIYYIYLQ
jgi:hypothetical protein